MKIRFALGLVAVAALLGGTPIAIAAESDAGVTATFDASSTAGTTNADAVASRTVPAISTAMPTVAAVHPAMAEVFHPAPVPDEDRSIPTRQVADAGPNLHPDFLGVREKADGALSDTDLAFSRNERMKPAGGMSLDIPMQ